MKKDYIPDTGDLSKDETKFQKDLWSEIWNKSLCTGDVSASIAAKEEARIVEPYITLLEARSKVLDGGCGLGLWTRYYMDRGFEVTGIDISNTTIEKLQIKFPEYRFMTGDIRNMPFADNYFDAYFSWGVFEHFEIGLGPCFKEAYRIIKPGGYLFVSVPFQNGRHLRKDSKKLWKWDEYFDSATGYSKKMRFYQWRLTVEELRREFAMQGFSCVKIRALHKTTGIKRMMKHDLKIGNESRWHKLAAFLLYRLVPASYTAHMILGIGIKESHT